jgi:hypothetical protein
MGDFLLKGIAQQGFGYLLFAGSLLVIFFMYRENRKLSEKSVEQADRRVEDLKEAQRVYNSLSESATKVAENTYTIVQNLQQLLNNAKKT